MKNKILQLFAILLTAGSLTSCEGEKDLIVSDVKSPIHTGELYLVGDAVPTGWSFEEPTPMQCSESDPYIFVYKGQLHEGEFKVSLAPTTTLDVDFIRPLYYGQEIGEEPLENVKFQMHADNPDEKWLVVANGTYSLTFNLRDWTLSTEYLGEFVQPEVEPIETETLYIVGSATSNGWNVWSAPETQKKSKYIFEYECWLNEGELRATTKRAWGYHIRPITDHVEIGKDGIADENFMYVWDPDINWLVTDAGNYHLTFDLEHWTLKTEYLGGENPQPEEKNPIKTDNLWMIGDATPTGWVQWGENPDSSTPLKRISEYVFQYEGLLTQGELRATPHYGWGAHIRPLMQHVEIGENGVADEKFMYVAEPDINWFVTKEGYYRITFDLENYTISAQYLENGPAPSDKDPIETPTLFMVGDATANGWDGNSMTALTRSDSDGYMFTYEGNLYTGEFKLYPNSGPEYPGWAAIRPKGGNAQIDKSDIKDAEFDYSENPDYKWVVKEAGKYRLSLDLRNWTMSCTYLGALQGIEMQVTPIATNEFFILGDAAPSGWDIYNPTPVTKISQYVFVYEGHLNTGRLRATPVKDWGTHVRPAVDNLSIDQNGVATPNFIYTANPDYNWNVEKAGNYKLTFDLEHWTLKAEYKD